MKRILKSFILSLLLTSVILSFLGCSGTAQTAQEALEQMGDFTFSRQDSDYWNNLTRLTIEFILDHYPTLGMQRDDQNNTEFMKMARLDRAEHLFNGEEAFSAIAGTNFPKDAYFLDMISENDRINHSEWNIENAYFQEVYAIKDKDKSYPNVSMYGYQFATRAMFLDQAWNNPIQELFSFGWCTHQESIEALYPVVKSVYEELKEKYGAEDPALEKALKSETEFLTFAGEVETDRILSTMEGSGFEGKIRLTLHAAYKPNYKLSNFKAMPYLTVVWQKEELSITGSKTASYFRGDPAQEEAKRDDPDYEEDPSKSATLSNFALDY